MTADDAGRYVRDGIPRVRRGVRPDPRRRARPRARRPDARARSPSPASSGFSRALVREALLLLEEDGKVVRERDRIWRVAPTAEPAAFTDSFHRMLGGRARPVRRLLVGIEDGSHWSHELLRGETQVLVWETVFAFDDVLLASTLEMMALAAAPPELTAELVAREARPHGLADDARGARPRTPGRPDAGSYGGCHRSRGPPSGCPGWSCRCTASRPR